MFAQYRATGADVLKRRRGTLFRRCVPAAVLLGILSTVAGCAATPRPFAGPDPSNPEASAPRTSYHSTTASYVSMRPVPPASWRPQNDRAAPKPKADQ